MLDIIYNGLDVILPFAWINHVFMKNAFLAVLMITPLLGILSTMVVSNRMAFFSDSLGHGAFTGVAVGVLLGSGEPLVSLIIFSIIFAALITYIKHRSSASTDTIIGVFSSAGIAIGLILMSHGGNFSNYTSYFIGDILSITADELVYLFITFIVVVIAWCFLFNQILIISINDGFAASRGIKTLYIEMIFAAIVAVVVSISIQWVGLLIINSLLILPAAAARNIAQVKEEVLPEQARNIAVNARQYHALSICFAICAGLLGLVISYYADIATGATIAIFAAIIFFITLFLRPYFQN